MAWIQAHVAGTPLEPHVLGNQVVCRAPMSSRRGADAAGGAGGAAVTAPTPRRPIGGTAGGPAETSPLPRFASPPEVSGCPSLPHRGDLAKFRFSPGASAPAEDRGAVARPSGSRVRLQGQAGRVPRVPRWRRLTGLDRALTGLSREMPGVATAVKLYGKRDGDEDARLELRAGSTLAVGGRHVFRGRSRPS